MSATLTWHHGTTAKTGTTNAACITDIATMVAANAGDANYSWEVASSDIVSNPLTLVLKPKSGAAGRILLAIYSSTPANFNPAVFPSSAVTSNALLVAFFPAGNVDSPSNLTAASGTVMGDDTNALQWYSPQSISSLYGANIAPFYFDSAEACVIVFNNPSTTTHFAIGAGYLAVDASDNAYAATFTTALSTPWNVFGGTSGVPFAWTTVVPLATSTTSAWRVNYGANNKPYFSAFAPSGAWANQAIGVNDILTDTSTSRAWFVAPPLMGQVKGEGFALKMRQIAWGPASTGPFAVYNTTGPVVAARQACSTTGGQTGSAWMTNFKL